MNSTEWFVLQTGQTPGAIVGTSGHGPEVREDDEMVPLPMVVVRNVRSDSDPHLYWAESDHELVQLSPLAEPDGSEDAAVGGGHALEVITEDGQYAQTSQGDLLYFFYNDNPGTLADPTNLNA